MILLKQHIFFARELKIFQFMNFNKWIFDALGYKQRTGTKQKIKVLNIFCEQDVPICIYS